MWFGLSVILVHINISIYAVDGTVNDVSLIQRLLQYDDANLRATGTKLMQRPYWYLS